MEADGGVGQATNDPKTCFCTLVTSDAYVTGAQALILSVIKAHWPMQRPFLVLYTPNVTKASLFVLKRIRHVVLMKVDAISGPEDPSRCVQAWQDYTKLRVWSLTEYERVVYLDADMLVFGSLDELFTRDLGCAGFAAAPDVFPPDRFNAGLLVVRPDIAVFHQMVENIHQLNSYDGGDTGFLNAFFPSWFNYPSSNRLPFIYNAQRTMYWFTKAQPGYWRALGDIKVIHYSSSPKPWLETEKRGELELLWWTTFSDLQLWIRSSS